MAKTKADWMAEAADAGHIAADANPDDYTVDQLKDMLGAGSSGDGDAPTVADTIANAPGIDAGNITPSPVVQSTTEETPAEADESSLPNAMDAKVNDPPVRAGRPDIPIAQTLAAGAGEHTPPDPDEFDSEGRPRDPNA